MTAVWFVRSNVDVVALALGAVIGWAARGLTRRRTIQ